MKPKKSLGQNFLRNTGIVEKIADFARISVTDTVLEIGPGRGILTRELAERADRVFALEKDDELAGRLSREFETDPRVTIINGDALSHDLGKITGSRFKLVSNLPYNVATNIILGLSKHPELLDCAVVMVQKEAGERICAGRGEKDYSALSVIMGCVFDTKRGFIVGPENFTPRPKIDSMVIRLDPLVDAVSGEEYETLKKVVFSVFSQRRKMLRNTLTRLPGMDARLVESMAQKCNIELSSRPQELSCKDFLAISRYYAKAVSSDGLL